MATHAAAALAAQCRLLALWWCLLPLTKTGAASSQGGHDTEYHAETGITVEVYYSPRCPNCLGLMRHSVVPFVEARLPGDKVRLTVLPLPFEVLEPRECSADIECSTKVAPLCALKATQPHPSPADSPALLPAVKFTACDLAHTAGSSTVGADTVRECAAEAGLPPDGLEACVRGPEVFGVMYSADYDSNAVAAMRRLEKAGFGHRLEMPLVFLDGELIRCLGAGCTARRTPAGDEPLEEPGSLLRLVCSRLDPQPKVCWHTDSAKIEPEVQVQECENCFEIRQSQWRVVRMGAGLRSPLWPLALFGAATCMVGLGLVCLARIRRRRRCDYEEALRDESML